MGDWEIKGSSVNVGERAMNTATLGFYPERKDFEVEHKETGETKTVTAFDAADVGRQLGKSAK